MEQMRDYLASEQLQQQKQMTSTLSPNSSDDFDLHDVIFLIIPPC